MESFFFSVRSEPHVNIENVDYYTKLVIRPVSRANSGQYTVTAVNSSGKDTALINVTITDKPTPPVGPLQVRTKYIVSKRHVVTIGYLRTKKKINKKNLRIKVSDVNKEGCKLNWKRPEDDGGTPIEYYLVEKFDVQKGSWIPCGQSPETGSFEREKA